MKKIDTSDWNIIRVNVNGTVVTTRTLQSREWEESFCKKHGYELLSFQKGTNRLCVD